MNIYTLNQEHNGIEIKFDSIPTKEIREELKESGFRWHNVKKVWYARQSESRIQLAQKVTGNKAKPEPTREDEPKKNKFGVAVGDIFKASWGYDQTNVDFFQVVELVGTSSVRVREVSPPIVESSGVCWAAEDRVYKVKGVGILPPIENSTFIDDQERGDLKRLKSYQADGVSCPQFKLSSYANAHHCGGDTVKCYVSWYA